MSTNANLIPSACVPLDGSTDRIILPVDPDRAGQVTVSGNWDAEEYGPGSVVIELKTVAGAQWTSHRIAADVSFALPPRTERLEAVVTYRTPGMVLELTLAQAKELSPPNNRQRLKLPRDPHIAGRWFTPTEAAARERRIAAYRNATYGRPHVIKEDTNGARTG